jgi:hypothetical protein
MKLKFTYQEIIFVFYPKVRLKFNILFDIISQNMRNNFNDSDW